jgi:hypothetical protein
MITPRPTTFARRASRAFAVAIACALVVPAAHAQRADTATAGVRVRADSAPARRARPVVVDSTPHPPITPKQAFLSSLLVPGLGEARLGRGGAASIFGGIEAFSLAMARKSAKDLHVAQRYENDSTFGPSTQTCGIVSTVVNGQALDTYTCTAPVRGPLLFNRYRGGRVGARRLHYEDWLAVLVFNHLISGADAFITAQLWDLPARVAVQPAPAGGTALAFSVRW